MKFVCIMGRTGSGKSEVERTLEKMGFKRIISYTSRAPEVRSGVQETSGNEYIFVTREKFMTLVNSGQIIEYEEYSGNLYGTPRPSGAKKYVEVVCVNGLRALRKIYGKQQVLGVYLRLDKETAAERAKNRDNSDNNFSKRYDEDNNLEKQMEEEADLIIDSGKDINLIVGDILKTLRK